MFRPKYLLKDRLHYDLFSIVFCLLYGLLVGFSIMLDPKLGVVVAILPLSVWLVLVDKIFALYLMLALYPFQATPFLSQNLLGISGAKPFHIISILVLGACFYHDGELFFKQDTLRRKAIVYLGIYFAIYSIAVFRSLDYHQLLYELDPESFDSTIGKYLLTTYIRPSLYLIPFIYILNHITTKKDIEKIVVFLSMVLGVLSIAIVVVSVSEGIIFARRSYIVWQKYFGYHYNAIGVFYTILGPLVVLPAIKKRFWGLVNWCLALVAVVFLQSRTSLFLFIFGSLLMLFFLDRKKELIIFLSILFLMSFYYLPEFLLNTIQIGVESGDLDKIFTGRIDHIWVPLISEWLENPRLLFLGKGRFSMVTSSVYLKGIVIQTYSAHNAFVEFFLDNGIILL